jgi:HAD superfamily hydrolase (TIGR01509 family)
MRLPGLIFDLDGTLVDSVYQHVVAWYEALRANGTIRPQWRIHRAIGMSGKQFLPKLLSEGGDHASPAVLEKLELAHGKRFRSSLQSIEPLPGAAELLGILKRRSIAFAVATSGDARQTTVLLKRLGTDLEFPVITADDVAAAKPSPDLFELAASKIEKEPQDCFVVGDSVWDVLAGRRMKASVIALRSGGFDGHELQESGAYRVYADPKELGESLEQLGIPPEPGRSKRR